jgi:hypothetical protein
MADYDYLPASNGSGDATLMHIMAARTIGATTIQVDSITNVPSKFIGTYGTLLASGLIDPTTKRDFKGHTIDATHVGIDAFEPGSTDAGNLATGQVIVIKPNTGFANRIATFIKNATNFGTPENIWVAILTAASAVISGTLSVGSDLTVTGNTVFTGTARITAASTASGSTITPTKQVYTVTALAANATIAVPSFTAADGMSLLLRIKDNGTARTLTFNSGYTNVSGLATPTTTVISKLLTIGAVYNSATSKWEIQGINQEA